MTPPSVCRFAVVSLLTLFGCGGDDLVLPGGDGAPELQIQDGSGQTGAAGAELDEQLVVRLVDEAGEGIPDRTVTWRVTAGGGTVTPGTATTDENGSASARWTLGPSAGSNTVEAAVSGVGTVTFTATGTVDSGDDGPSAELSTLSADPTTIAAGSGSSTITVTVRDAGGNPVEGATVTLEATGSGNTLVQPSGPTGSDGIAVGTLGSTEAGTRTVSATVNGSVRILETVEVTVTADAQPRLELIEGDDQTAPAGSSVPLRPAVRALDAEGRPLGGIQVTFVVTAGGGTVDGDVQTTNADGIARSGDWTLGTAPGANVLEARAGSLEGSPVVFTAEGVAGGAGVVDHFIFLLQPPDVGEEEFFTVEVAMVDVNGVVVPTSGVEIYLGLFREDKDEPSNDRLQGDRFEETINGIAVFNVAVTKNDQYRLRALSDELPELGPHGPEPFLTSRVFEVR